MAGDVHYIYIMDNKKDDNKKIIKEMYLGKMRYWNSEFSLSQYKYHDDSSNFLKNVKGKYNLLERLANGSETYSVLNLNTINKIRSILNNKPITKQEEEAYQDTKDFIDFVDENLDMIKSNDYDVVFFTSHD